MLVRVDYNTFRQKYLLTTNTVFVHETKDVWTFYSQDLFIIVKCTVEKSASTEENIMFIERLVNSGHQNNIIKVLDADDGYGNTGIEVPQTEETEYPEAAQEGDKIKETNKDVDYVDKFAGSKE